MAELPRKELPHQVLLSEDGSHTLMSATHEVTYHSKYGAVAESQHVFLDAGLKYLLQNGKEDLRVFGMGFGTGLNALMTLQLANGLEGVKINYHTIEIDPIDLALVDQLNYVEALACAELKDAFYQMHQVDSRETVELSDQFSFTKIIGDVQAESLPDQIDVIYYDAFAPSSQPELWEVTLLQKLYDLLNKGGVLVTYCAKGSFKRALKEVGFVLDCIPGPHGKREMTRAIKA